MTERIRLDTPPVQMHATPGEEILIAATIDQPSSNLPAIVYTPDGQHWFGADEEARSNGGTSSNTQPACWTGDRFLVGISGIAYPYTHSPVLQSFDGKRWSWHPHPVLGSADTYPSIYQMAADGQGVVAIAGYAFNGVYPDSGNNQLAVSRDMGATWVLPTLPDGAYPSLVAVAGNTIVSSGSSAYSDESAFSTDGGFRWQQIDFGDLEGMSLYFILPVAGAWWFCGYAGVPGGGVIWKTTDFRTWERVLNPWDDTWPALADIPYNSYTFGGVTYYYRNFATAYSMFKGGPDGRSVVVLGSSGEGPYGSILVTPDAGTTWKIVVDTDEAVNWIGTPSEPDMLIGFPPMSIDVYLGAAYAFEQWFITNYETPGASDTPAMLVASKDFQTWRGIQLPTELQGDDYYYYISGYGPIIAGGV